MAVDDLWYLARRDSASGKRLPSKRHGRGKRWRVRNASTPSQLFASKADAERVDAVARADLARGAWIDPVAGRELLSERAASHRTGQLHRASTDELTERTFRLHIDPVLGHMPIGQVRPSHIQAWVKGVDLAPSTARVAYSQLVAIFAAAVRDRVIPSSPCVGITLPALADAEHVILTPAQVHTVAAALPERYRALVYVGAGCGLRHGEALGLELRHIDFLRREVNVQQQLTVTSGRSPYLAQVKTRTSRRVVELPQVTADALARHIEQYPPAGVELSDETDLRSPKVRPAPLVFTNGQRRPIHRASWSHSWKPAAEAAGLPPKIGFHALRHYFATLLIFSGASVKTVQIALGHSTPMITLNTYVGLWPDQIDRTRSLVDAALGASPGLAVAT